MAAGLNQVCVAVAVAVFMYSGIMCHNSSARVGKFREIQFLVVVRYSTSMSLVCLLIGLQFAPGRFFQLLENCTLGYVLCFFFLLGRHASQTCIIF